jgi:hypothetical protein
MQDELKKRDGLIQDLRHLLQTPTNQAAELAKEIERLKASQSELRRSQDELLARATPERATPKKVGKWQEFLETPISVSQRRSRRETPGYTSRFQDEDILPKSPRTVIPPPSPPMILSPVRLQQTSLPPVHPPTSKDNDEITRLREQLLKAQQEISQLKTEKVIGRGPSDGHEAHSRPLLPNMMPGTSQSSSN